MDEKQIIRELQEIRAQIADLSKRLDEAERKPAEILEEIERIWKMDPETSAVVSSLP